MRLAIVLIWFILEAQTLWGQNRIDSLNALLETAPQKQLPEIYIAIGRAYYARGDNTSFSVAVANYLKAMKLARELGNKKMEAQAMVANAVVNETRLDELEEAVALIQGALKLYTETKDSLGMAEAYHVYSAILLKQKKLEAASEKISLAIGILQRRDSTNVDQAYYLRTLSNIYKQQNNFAEAEKFLLQARAKCYQLGYIYGLNDILPTLTLLYFENGHPQKGLDLLDEWKPNLNKKNSFHVLLFHKYTAACLEGLGKFAEANKELNIAYDYALLVCNETSTQQLNEMRAKFETDIRNQENKILRQESETQKAQNVIIVVVALFLAFVAAGVYRRSRYLQQIALQKQTTLEQSQTLLQTQLQLQKAEALRQSQEKELLEAQNQLQEEENQRLQWQMEAEKTEASLRQKEIEAELAGVTFRLTERKAVFEELYQRVEQVIETAPKQRAQELEKLRRFLKQELSDEQDWLRFKTYFEQAHSGFYDRLEKICPDISPNETKMAAYIRMNMSAKEMAHLLNVSIDAVNKARYRFKKKLNLSETDSLTGFLSNL